MRILIIEDQSKVAQSVKHGLEAERFDVTVAATGEDGFFLVSSQVFDLLILDLMLPGRDGLEILRRIRGNEKTARLPVIILTARGAPEDRIKGLNLGADDYLPKPFELAELEARIRALLRRSSNVNPLNGFNATASGLYGLTVTCENGDRPQDWTFVSSGYEINMDEVE